MAGRHCCQESFRLCERFSTAVRSNAVCDGLLARSDQQISVRKRVADFDRLIRGGNSKVVVGDSAFLNLLRLDRRHGQ